MPKLPSYQDVGNVSPTIMRDPGVNAPAAAFESPLGIAARELAPAIAEVGKAQRETYIAGIETSARNKIKEIYSKNFDNPDGLKGELDKYLENEEKTIRSVSPKLAPEFRTKFSLWTQPYFSRSLSNYKQRESENVRLSGADLEAQSISDINEHAADMFSSDPNVSRHAQRAIGDSLLSLRHGTSQQRYRESETADDAGIIERENEQDKLRSNQIFENAVVQGARSWFQSQPDKPGAFLSWKQGKFSPTVYREDGTQTQIDLRSLSPRAKGDLNSWIEQEFVMSVSTAESAERAMADLEKRERNVNEFDAWSMVYTDDSSKRLKPADVTSLVHSRKIDPESGKQMLEALNREENQRDDEALMLSIENEIYNGTNARKMINTGFRDGLLTGKTSSRLLALNQREVFPDKDKPQDPYSRFRKLLHDSTQQKGPMAVDFGGEPERRARALIEYDQLTLSEGVDPQAAFDDVLERTKIGIGSINLNTERLILPRFSVGGRDTLDVNATAKRLREAFDQKRISKQELLEEARRIKEWETALAKTQQAQAAAAQRKKGK